MSELLMVELAAKAMGYEYVKPGEGYDGSIGLCIGSNPMRTQVWDPSITPAIAQKCVRRYILTLCGMKMPGWLCVNTQFLAMLRRKK